MRKEGNSLRKEPLREFRGNAGKEGRTRGGIQEGVSTPKSGRGKLKQTGKCLQKNRERVVGSLEWEGVPRKRDVGGALNLGFGKRLCARKKSNRKTQAAKLQKRGKKRGQRSKLKRSTSWECLLGEGGLGGNQKVKKKNALG